MIPRAFREEVSVSIAQRIMQCQPTLLAGFYFEQQWQFASQTPGGPGAL